VLVMIQDVHLLALLSKAQPAGMETAAVTLRHVYAQDVLGSVRLAGSVTTMPSALLLVRIPSPAQMNVPEQSGARVVQVIPGI
jgi:hypothetical protein